MSARLALIAGAGGALGQALCAEFAAAGYRVAPLRRGSDNALRDAETTRRAVARIVDEQGPPQVLVCNAAHLRIAPFAELQPADFEAAWHAAVGTALGCVQAVLPGMLQQGRGALLFSGATASLRGGARFAAFASAKFALRGLVQSLAREFQPQGLHVAHVLIDGLLRGSASAQRFNAADERTLDPAAVARSYRWLAEQERSAWTHEIDLRPFSENF